MTLYNHIMYVLYNILYIYTYICMYIEPRSRRAVTEPLFKLPPESDYNVN